MYEIIFKTLFGSKMYGTAIESSDTDYKGIFIPNKHDLYLGKYTKSINKSEKNSDSIKNSKEDIDYEICSIQHFGFLAFSADTMAIDMLCSPKNCWEITTNNWLDLYSQRNKFLSKNLNSFVDYSKKQAAKYGIKGSRLNICNEIIQFLGEKDASSKLIKYVDFFNNVFLRYPDEFLLHLDKNEEGAIIPHSSYLEVVGKRFVLSAPIDIILVALCRFSSEYGKRAQLAAQNEGIDWKAVHHAFRFSYLVSHIIDEEKFIEFPLPETDFLIKIKKAEYTFIQLQPLLENLIQEVNQKLEKSNFPKEVDKKWFDEFVINLYEGMI